MRLSLIPRNQRFYDLFEKSASNLLRASEALTDLLGNFENVEMKTSHIKDLEKVGDDCTHQLYLELNQSFVTPLDREDISALAQRMDDVMDYMEGAATAVHLYAIAKPTKAARNLADLIRLQCVEIVRAVGNLRRSSNIKKIHDQLVEIHRLENEADTQFLSASADLFGKGMDAEEIIKWRDIYDQLEQATDSAEGVAHVLEGIVIKHA